MATFDNESSAFSTSLTSGPMPRWQRKATEAAAQVQTPRGPKTPTHRAKTPTHRTPRSRGNTPQACRFIPNRTLMDMDACHFHLKANENAACSSPSKQEYQRSIKSSLLGDATNCKVLAFGERPPAPKEGFQSEAKVLFTQNRTQKAAKSARHIPQAAERILDAPGYKVDFYLNLLDWSSTNVIAVALDTTVYLWNATTGTIDELCTMEESNAVSSLAWSQDGTFLSIGTEDSLVQLWDVTRTKKVRTMRGHQGRVAAQAWNQHILSTGARNGTILNNDVRERDHVVATMTGHTQEVCGLKWSPDGAKLASGGNDNVVNIWSANGARDHSLTQHMAAVKALAWCPWQSNLLATGGGTADRTIKFWNTANGNCVNSIDTKSQVSSLVWNAEHRELISGHGFSENQLTIWKYPTMTKVTELTGHTERVLSMAISPDGTTVVSAAGDETLRFWKCFAACETATKKKKKQADAGASRLTGMIR